MTETRLSDEEPHERTPEALGFPRPEINWFDWLWINNRPELDHEHYYRRETDVDE